MRTSFQSLPPLPRLQEHLRRCQAQVSEAEVWHGELPVPVLDRSWLQLEVINVAALLERFPADSSAHAPELMRFRTLLQQNVPADAAEAWAWWRMAEVEGMLQAGGNRQLLEQAMPAAVLPLPASVKFLIGAIPSLFGTADGAAHGGSAWNHWADAPQLCPGDPDGGLHGQAGQPDPGVAESGVEWPVCTRRPVIRYDRDPPLN